MLLKIENVAGVALNIVLVTAVIVGLLGFIFFKPQPPILIQEKTITVTETKVYYDCEPFGRIQYILDLIGYGFDEIVYLGSNSLFTRALNLISTYINEVQHSNKTYPAEYVNALINLQGLVEAFQRGNIKSAYIYYAVANAEFNKLGIVSGCYVK
jgi:hypothetical protein